MRRPPQHATRRGHGRLLLLLAAVAMVSAGAALGLHILDFYRYSSARGHELVRRELATIAAADRRPTGCPAHPDAAVLHMPTLDVVAPVVLGSSASVLADAVGLEPASAPPGDTGTTVLAAHDVTWFSGIDQLHVGDPVVVDVACRALHYVVTGHRVTTEGSPVGNTAKGNELVLVTCWPTDALWLTNERYLVTATLVSTQATVASATPTTPTSPLVAPQVAGLSPAQLTATANEAPLGALTESGTPSPSWTQSPAPLQVEQAALGTFFATEHSAATGNVAALDVLATGPAVALPHDTAPLFAAAITHYWSTVSLDLDVASTTVQQVSIATRVALAGGARPGLYDVEVTEVPIGDTLHVASWQMTPY